MELEHRAAVEVRAAGRRLEGLAAPFGVETRIGSFRETIIKGAFAASLASGRDVRALVDHDDGKLLGRSRSGTLRLAEGERGLEFSLDIPSTTLGSDILALAERNDLGGMSFGFRASPGGETWRGRKRELRAVELHEVSVIHSFSAYPATELHARARLSPCGYSPRLVRARLWLETL